jgi:hypothetical protein
MEKRKAEMKPTDFPFANKTLQKPQGWTDEECSPLPVFTDGALCISCWQMSWKERLSALIFGKLWIRIYSGPTQPPILPEIVRTISLEDPWVRRWEKFKLLFKHK